MELVMTKRDSTLCELVDSASGQTLLRTETESVGLLASKRTVR